jgi:hypothetical protein
MTDPVTWLTQRHHRIAPLFDHDDHLVVATKTIGPSNRVVLRRHPDMEQAVIDTVTAGLGDPNWLGILYVMGHGAINDFRPRYIGKAAGYGRTNAVSANIRDIENNTDFFARWGDGRAYHIGDLSEALLALAANQPASPKYADWVDDLFALTAPPTLRVPVLFYVTSWYRGDCGPDGQLRELGALETHLIKEIGATCPRSLLNKQHNPRPYQKRAAAASSNTSAFMLAAPAAAVR